MIPSLQETTLGRFQVNRDLAFLLVAVVGFAMPFLAQPFHMDDNFYMDMARNARLKPLFPNDTPYVFEGRSLPDMGSHSHPPLLTYFLAGVQSLAGEGPGKEWIYHLCALVFPVLAVLSFYFISALLVERPLWPSLALACSPLFLVMQHNLMTDIPALAFWLAAIATFIWGTRLRSNGLLALSSVLQFGAMFTSYQCVALTPLLLFWQIRKRGKAAGWLALALPLVLMTGWFTLNYAHYHRMILIDTLGYVESRHAATLAALGRKFVAVLQYQGWLLIFPFFLLYAFAKDLRGRLFLIASLASLYLAQLVVERYRWPEKSIFVIGIVTGLFVLSRMVLFFAQSLRDRSVEAQFIGLWYFGTLAYCFFLFTEGSARYILPLGPPVLVYFFRRLEISEVPEYRQFPRPLLSSAMVASGSVVLSLAWGLSLAHADQEFARIYPKAAQECSRLVGRLRAYYAGEWGFRYYFAQAGMEQLPIDESSVGGGSFVIKPKLALRYDMPAALNSMSMPVQTLAYTLNTRLRTLDWQTPAGFYSSAWGLIPFSLSGRSLEEIEICQINFLIERLPWARIQTNGSIAPWPGYVAIQEQAPLALLLKPRSIVTYSWTASEALRLDVSYGVAPDGYTIGTESNFQFAIRQLDSNRHILLDHTQILNPGVKREDRNWQHARLLLNGASQDANLLELEFSASDNRSQSTGAFARPLLSQP